MDTRSSFQLGLAICIFSVTYSAKAKKCDPGFYLDSKRNCTDDNECGDNESTSSARCGAHTDCYNTQGSYYCTCKKGFSNQLGKTNFTSRMNCHEINECYQKPPVCGPNTICHNTMGSFYCLCKKGFITRLGLTNFTDGSAGCIDINECVTDICGLNAECTNTFGSFKCTCKKGFTPGERTFTNKTKTGCQNVDECLNVMERCGPNANCVDALGSFNCSCKNGFVSTGEATFTDKTKIQCKALESLRPRSSSFQDVNTFVGQSIKSLFKFENRNSEEFHRLISNFLNIIEKYSIKAARNLSHEEIKNFSTDQFDVIIQAIRNNTIPKGRRAKLATANNIMDIDWNSVAGKESFDVAAAALISIKQLDCLMGANISDSADNETKLELISEVVTATVTNTDKENLAGNVILTFKHKKYNNQTTKCVYWDSLASVWSTHGCMLQHSNATHTVCTCTHLSSFAVLMALYEIKGPHIYNLDMITIVGIILSLVCLFISILTFTLCRSIKSIRTTIHTHLCLSLFLAELLFLIGISRTENKTGCAIVAGFLHYLFLTSFAWMLLEGVQLYLMVVKVFNAKSLQLKYMCLFGYGFPLLVVGISAAAYAQGYGTKEYCWLDLKSGFIWAFLIPVSLIILVNAGFFIITVWRLVDKFSSLNPDMNELKKIRAFTITAVAQLCLLGCMWIFGILHFQENTIAMTYIFTIINSLQGVFIFTLHCLFNKQVRDEYAKILVSICHMKKASKYSEFSTSSTQGLKSTHETGM
ncbi:adhesion G protein-coupled receptor E2-like isoform X2 [Carcharodon carcharias]|uniref:adhesion G protein-coupled receptor E2-like isoform X2 n=1 Tax=Carcharodon carcharias TaxID=13397 RepID=UPI001B7F4A24|nr:adhesion G protein-coupled receptor E2-like isoform X2 [Carcharodon carcharias]